jgi:hypothetical protein
MRVEEAVLERYSRGVERREEELCCPVEYDARYLKAIPAEILERDYGCGDPSAHLRPGETVLDRLYTREPYARDPIAVEPLVPVSAAEAKPFDCSRDAIRQPRETKGLDYDATTEAPSGCDGNGSCC